MYAQHFQPSSNFGRREEMWTESEREGEYRRVKRTFVPLYRTSIRVLDVALGQLRDGGEITQYMGLLIERNDYPAGGQFLFVRLSTMRKVAQWVVSKGWGESRRLNDHERMRLDRAAGVDVEPS